MKGALIDWKKVQVWMINERRLGNSLLFRGHLGQERKLGQRLVATPKETLSLTAQSVLELSHREFGHQNDNNDTDDTIPGLNYNTFRCGLKSECTE